MSRTKANPEALLREGAPVSHPPTPKANAEALLRGGDPAHREGRLLYLMGPSGAGKDSLLAWVVARLAPQSGIHLARRTITRPLREGDEQHHSVDLPTFERLRAEEAFALAWHANGLHYGIRHAELATLARGDRVIVNGSRAYLPEAMARFPRLAVLHVSAAPATLRARLLAREREAPPQVEARLQRNEAFALPEGAIEIRNDGTLEAAGERLLAAIAGL